MTIIWKRRFAWLSCIFSAGLVLVCNQANPAVDEGGGYSASKLKMIDTATLAQKIRDKKNNKYQFTILDTRNEVDYLKGSIPGAVNLPFKKHRFLAQRVAPTSEDIVCYGYSGNHPAAFDAVIYLANNGYEHVWLYQGGYELWKGSSESRSKEDSQAPAQKIEPQLSRTSGVLISK